MHPVRDGEVYRTGGPRSGEVPELLNDIHSIQKARLARKEMATVKAGPSVD